MTSKNAAAKIALGRLIQAAMKSDEISRWELNQAEATILDAMADGAPSEHGIRVYRRGDHAAADCICGKWESNRHYTSPRVSMDAAARHAAWQGDGHLAIVQDGTRLAKS